MGKGSESFSGLVVWDQKAPRRDRQADFLELFFGEWHEEPGDISVISKTQQLGKETSGLDMLLFTPPIGWKCWIVHPQKKEIIERIREKPVYIWMKWSLIKPWAGVRGWLFTSLRLGVWGVYANVWVHIGMDNKINSIPSWERYTGYKEKGTQAGNPCANMDLWITWASVT